MFEWYDDEYFAKPDKPGNFNPKNDAEVQELYQLLTVDGIPDINEVYPKWVIRTLQDPGYIEEEQSNYAWIMTQEGLAAFPTLIEFKKYLLEEGGFIKPKVSKFGNDNESPYLRGNETESG